MEKEISKKVIEIISQEIHRNIDFTIAFNLESIILDSLENNNEISEHIGQFIYSFPNSKKDILSKEIFDEVQKILQKEIPILVKEYFAKIESETKPQEEY